MGTRYAGPVCSFIQLDLRGPPEERTSESKSLKDKGTNHEGVFGESFPAKGIISVKSLR